jgi:ketosteroid isomerase-like protein
MSQQNPIAEADAAINAAILNGAALEAFETYFADDVVMQENDSEPTIGKEANRKREEEFFGAITEFRGAKLISAAVGDNVSFSHWFFDFTHFDWGVRTYHQTAVRYWQDGKVIREVFYYGN